MNQRMTARLIVFMTGLIVAGVAAVLCRMPDRAGGGDEDAENAAGAASGVRTRANRRSRRPSATLSETFTNEIVGVELIPGRPLPPSRALRRRHHHCHRRVLGGTLHHDSRGPLPRQPAVHRSTTCVRCSAALPVGRLRYCSDACRMEEKYLRYKERVIERYGSVDLAPEDIRQALTIKAMAASVGYRYGSWSRVPQELRQRLAQRSGGICEGCRERRATDVHHVRRPAERLDDLRHLCAVCHRRLTACHGGVDPDDMEREEEE